MSYFPGDSELNSILIDLLRNTPPSPGKRRALIRLLWNEAAGATISQHVVIRKCHSDGRVSVEVNDIRWMKPIKDAAHLIIQRINTALAKMRLEEYSVYSLDIFPTPPQPPRRKKPTKTVRPPPEIPPHLQKRIDTLPDNLKRSFSEWYLAAQANQEPELEN